MFATPTRTLRRLAAATSAMLVCAPAIAQTLDPQPTPIIVGGLGGGGRVAPPTNACITPAQRADVQRRIDAYRAAFGSLPNPGDNPPGPFTFFPQAGNLWEELPVSNFVDLDGSAGIRDFQCSTITYDGHQGHDALIRSFGEQIIGVPIFAAMDGVVVATQDGHPDMNTVAAGQPANFVIIDHGGGRIVYYWHLRNGSVSVSVGQTLAAGEQIGMTASSGNSNWPHLHFETHDGGPTYEPNAGPCRPGPSGWTDQVPIPAATYALDAGITHELLSQATALPAAPPRAGQVAVNDPRTTLWVELGALPANSTWRLRFRNPNGSIVWQSGNVSFGNSRPFGFSWWWWWQNVPQVNGTLGIWTCILDINGTTVVEAPFELVAQRDPNTNAPPVAVTASFDPTNPGPGDVVFCRVAGPLVLDDPDFDILEYTYEWKVNGTPVRTITTAARADAVPRGTLQPGDVLECTVTVSDGRLSTAPITVTSGCYADCDQSGSLDIFDFLCFQNAFVAAEPYACDCDPDPACNIFDFLCFQDAFVTGCP